MTAIELPHSSLACRNHHTPRELDTVSDYLTRHRLGRQHKHEHRCRCRCRHRHRYSIELVPNSHPESDSLMRAGEMSSDGFPSGADSILARDKRQLEALLNTYIRIPYNSMVCGMSPKQIIPSTAKLSWQISKGKVAEAFEAPQPTLT